MKLRRRFDNGIEHPRGQNIIAVGQFTTVHKLSDKVVQIEGRVYSHLGKHPRIAHCLKTGSDFVDLRYESNGDLETYLKQNPLTSDTKYRLAQQAVEAVVYVYGKDVIHSDLSARQFLVGQDLNIRLSDFGGSSLQGSDALVLENATHFLPRDEASPNAIQSDLFALGSTLYEILLGKRPYEEMEDEEIQRLFSDKVFPTLDGIGDQQWRSIVQKCWLCEYGQASEILDDIPRVHFFKRILARIQSTVSQW